MQLLHFTSSDRERKRETSPTSGPSDVVIKTRNLTRCSVSCLACVPPPYKRRHCKPRNVVSFLFSTQFASVLQTTRAAIAQSVQRWAMDWTIGVLGLDSWRGQGIFLFTIASRTALRPTQLPFLSNGYKGLFPWG
jgi:hypothetical protein